MRYISIKIHWIVNKFRINSESCFGSLYGMWNARYMWIVFYRWANYQWGKNSNGWKIEWIKWTENAEGIWSKMLQWTMKSENIGKLPWKWSSICVVQMASYGIHTHIIETSFDVQFSWLLLNAIGIYRFTIRWRMPKKDTRKSYMCGLQA